MSKDFEIQKSALLSKWNKILAISVVLAAALHFFVVNDLSTSGFVFKDLKSKVNQLTADKQTMESSISSLGSYQNISPRIQALHLVAADNIHYLSWDENMVARK